MQDDRQGEMLIRREERNRERAKAKAEAAKQNMTDMIAAYMKDEDTKKAIATDAMAATKEPHRRDQLYAQAGDGIFGGEATDITGMEPKPWER